MSNVALTIGGRRYTVACAPGEEDHITELGQAIDAKIQSMGQLGTNETRQLLFAALLLADEVHEVKFRSNAPATPAEPAAPIAAAAATPAMDDSLAEQLEAIAAKLEFCALALEA